MFGYYNLTVNLKNMKNNIEDTKMTISPVREIIRDEDGKPIAENFSITYQHEKYWQQIGESNSAFSFRVKDHIKWKYKKIIHIKFF